jgi:serine/threonine protein kinase
MFVTGALDVWSLGYFFYEFLTGLLWSACSCDDNFAAAAGQVLFPWEEQHSRQQRTHMQRLGLLQGLILAMLDRDHVRRNAMTKMY